MLPDVSIAMTNECELASASLRILSPEIEKTSNTIIIMLNIKITKFFEYISMPLILEMASKLENLMPYLFLSLKAMK